MVNKRKAASKKSDDEMDEDYRKKRDRNNMVNRFSRLKLIDCSSVCVVCAVTNQLQLSQ